MKDVHVASLYDYMHFAGFYVFNVECFKLNSSNESNMQIYLRHSAKAVPRQRISETRAQHTVHVGNTDR